MNDFIIDKSFKCPGVYIIKCIQTNYHYIGSSQNVYERLKVHKGMLKTGKHFNKKMNADYKAGYDFKIDLLQTFEYEPQNIRIAIEYSYILEMYKRGLYLYNREVWTDSDPETFIKNVIIGRVSGPYDISFNCTYYNLISNKGEV